MTNQCGEAVSSSVLVNAEGLRSKVSFQRYTRSSSFPPCLATLRFSWKSRYDGGNTRRASITEAIVSSHRHSTPETTQNKFHVHSRYQPLAAAAEHALPAVTYCLHGNSNKSGPFYQSNRTRLKDDKQHTRIGLQYQDPESTCQFPFQVGKTSDESTNGGNCGNMQVIDLFDTQGDSDVISSYYIYASCFSAMLQVKLCKMFLTRTSLSL